MIRVVFHFVSQIIYKQIREKYENKFTIIRRKRRGFKMESKSNMIKKEIYLVNAKLKFKDNTQDIVPFYVEADSEGKAETKLEKWLLEGCSGWKFTEILSIRVKNNIWVIQ